MADKETNVFLGLQAEEPGARSQSSGTRDPAPNGTPQKLTILFLSPKIVCSKFALVAPKRTKFFFDLHTEDPGAKPLVPMIHNHMAHYRSSGFKF